MYYEMSDLPHEGSLESFPFSLISEENHHQQLGILLGLVFGSLTTYLLTEKIKYHILNLVDNLISLCIKTTTTTTSMGLGPPCHLAVSLASSWPCPRIHSPPVRACSGTKIASLQG